MPGASHESEATIRKAGGSANLCRAANHKSLYDCFICGAIGDDAAGTYVLEELAKYGTPVMETEYGADTTTATVIVDYAKNERTGFVHWGACRKHKAYPNLDVDWNHFMYLDTINVSPERLAMYDNISADFCDPSTIMEYRGHLKHVDVLITSHDPSYDVSIAASWTRRGAILHSPERIESIVDGKEKTLLIKKSHGLNVLGAGDYFAAFAIANLLRKEMNLEGIHNDVLDMLLRQS